MSYIINITPIQKKGVAFQTINSGTLTIENPDEPIIPMPVVIPIAYDIPLNSWYFPVNTIFNVSQGFRFTIELNFTLVDGTICDRTFVFYDEILPLAAYTTGFSVGFES